MAHLLLVEPYYGGSHRAWADGWIAASRHDIALISHPADFWRWRMRGAALTLAEQTARHVASHGHPDAVIASDMIDLSSYLGFARRTLGDTPAALYMHENQLLYPLGPNQQPNEALSLTNWRAVAAADAVWFNSAFQRRGFLDQLPALLTRQPDQRHLTFIDDAEARSSVIPVGVDSQPLIAAARPRHGDVPLVLWNQRWDHDKNPGAVFRALNKLAEAEVPFELALAGENQRVDPQEFAWIQEQLGDRVVHVGHLPRVEYVELLLRSDVVVSAAHHEFFGIAIVEAIAAGAIPVLPDRQSYPEIIPAEWHESVLYPDGDLRRRLETVLTNPDTFRAANLGLREAMAQWDWSAVAPQMDTAVDQLITAND